MTKYNGTNQYEPRLLSRISQYNYLDNSSLSNISREMTDSDTRPRTKITIPDNILVSTNSNNGLVYNIRNKLWYPSTSQSSQYQYTYTTRQITASSHQPRSSKEQFSSEFVTKSSTYFPIKLTTTIGIERSRSYRREKNSDDNFEKFSTPGKIFGGRVVQSADIQVITQKTSAILSVNNIKFRHRDMIVQNLSSLITLNYKSINFLVKGSHSHLHNNEDRICRVRKKIFENVGGQYFYKSKTASMERISFRFKGKAVSLYGKTVPNLGILIVYSSSIYS